MGHVSARRAATPRSQFSRRRPRRGCRRGQQSPVGLRPQHLERADRYDPPRARAREPARHDPALAREHPKHRGPRGYAATIENGSSFRGLAGASGVGTEGGSEDHTAILCSEVNRLAQYAFCPTRHERSIACADDVVFAIGFSGVAARKTGGTRDDYNRAAQQVQRALSRWNTETTRDDMSLAAALGSAPDAASRLRDLLRADDQVLVERVDQFIEENTGARAGGRRPVRARRLVRARRDGGAIARACRARAQESGHRNRYPRSRGADPWGPRCLGVWRWVRRKRLGAGRSGHRRHVPRSVAERVRGRLPCGRLARGILCNEAGGSGNAEC